MKRVKPPMCIFHSKNNHGFTLVELSVVLVIIGLLAAGVLVGTDMIRAGEIKAIISDIHNFKSAINSFRDKYKALPGDFRKAEDFWPTTTTLNGDGDGQIDEDGQEDLMSWQQLALANLISGSYTGLDAGTPDYQINVNVPASKLKGGGYELGWPTSAIYGRSGNVISFGAENTSTNQLSSPILPPADAWSIDNKMDDGLIQYGEVISRDGLDDTGTAMTNACLSAGDYVKSNPNNGCRMNFWIN